MKTSFSDKISPKYKTRAVTQKKGTALPPPDVGIKRKAGNINKKGVTTGVILPTSVVVEDNSQPEPLQVGESPVVLQEKLSPIKVVANEGESPGLSPVHNPNATNEVSNVQQDEVSPTSNLINKDDDIALYLDDANHAKRLPIFLKEPFHIKNLIVNGVDIEKLNGENYLTTNLINFLIKFGIPFFKPEDFLVPMCNVGPLFDLFNEKAESTNELDKKFVQIAREKYKNFSTKPFRVTFVNCYEDHFFVIFMIFDPTDREEDYFQYIKVYDSMFRAYRNGRFVQLPNTLVTNLLLKFQKFVLNYILYDTDNPDVLSDPKLVLRDVTYHQCPRPSNEYDTALYAYGILLHLVSCINITSTIFTQNEITYFRKSLYIIFNAPIEEVGMDPTKWMSTEFINSFFRFKYFSSNEENLFLDYLHRFTNYKNNSPTKNTDDEDYYDEEYNEEMEDDVISGTNEDLKQSNQQSNNEQSNQRENIVPYFDETFKEIFLDINSGLDVYCFTDLEEVSQKIEMYEFESKNKLRISKSVATVGSRLYTCVAHEGCQFRAAFGPRRGDKQLVLKNVLIS